MVKTYCQYNRKKWVNHQRTWQKGSLRKARCLNNQDAKGSNLQPPSRQYCRPGAKWLLMSSSHLKPSRVVTSSAVSNAWTSVNEVKEEAWTFLAPVFLWWWVFPSMTDMMLCAYLALEREVLTAHTEVQEAMRAKINIPWMSNEGKYGNTSTNTKEDPPWWTQTGHKAF